jgi:hypothetical protein
LSATFAERLTPAPQLVHENQEQEQFMQHRFLYALCSLSIVALMFGCSKSEPLTPTVPSPPSQAPADGTTYKVTAPSLVSPVNDVRLENFNAPQLNAGAVQSTLGASISPQYRFQLLSSSGALLQDSGLRSSTNWTPTLNNGRLGIDTRYLWQVRAEQDGDIGPWSPRGSFLSAKGSFQQGQEVLDLLTDGQTVGNQVGGYFIPGQGWHADSTSAGIDYDIPTCSACTIEFDVTHFGRGEGRNIKKDVKWLSMGDANAFGNFGLFRNHAWKMHLEQRGDGNGTGMKLIWRNGRAGDGDPGDHEGKVDPTSINWRQDGVFHFTITWHPGGYAVWVGETQPNGSVAGNQIWFAGGFARAYAPPNHRISLGTRSRSETLEGTYRNVKIYPGPPRN